MKKNIININSFEYRFGCNLARIRNSMGLTHLDMDQTGLTRSYYGKVEKGYYSISLSKINLIAKTFGIPISSLFLDENGRDIT